MKLNKYEEVAAVLFVIAMLILMSKIIVNTYL
jgi:hypothetical protein